jgi:hypothetical protein
MFLRWQPNSKIKDRGSPQCEPSSEHLPFSRLPSFLIGHGTPRKRQVTKRQVSKRPVSKRPKRQVYKTSGLQNVRFTNVSSSKRPVTKKHPYIFCACGWRKSVGSVAAMFAGKDGCVLFSNLEGFLPYITVMASNK